MGGDSESEVENIEISESWVHSSKIKVFQREVVSPEINWITRLKIASKMGSFQVFFHAILSCQNYQLISEEGNWIFYFIFYLLYLKQRNKENSFNHDELHEIIYILKRQSNGECL